MTALDNKLLGVKQCAELIVKDINLAISSLEEERKHKDNNKVWGSLLVRRGLSFR